MDRYCAVIVHTESDGVIIVAVMSVAEDNFEPAVAGIAVDDRCVYFIRIMDLIIGKCLTVELDGNGNGGIIFINFVDHI